MERQFEQKKAGLWAIRSKLLRFHKTLLDQDREIYEREVGVLEDGRFLGLLLNDERFAWLRTVSSLIVQIDESFDLDDGLSGKMIDDSLSAMSSIFEDSEKYPEFGRRLADAIRKNPLLAAERQEILRDIKEWV